MPSDFAAVSGFYGDTPLALAPILFIRVTGISALAAAADDDWDRVARLPAAARRAVRPAHADLILESRRREHTEEAEHAISRTSAETGVVSRPGPPPGWRLAAEKVRAGRVARDVVIDADLH